MERLKTIELFAAPLEEAKISYFITGSTASIFYGEPRLTLDIDIVIHLSEVDVERFISLFPEKDFYCPPEDVIQIERNRSSHGHFNLIHPESGFKADIYPASDDPLYQWAFQHRRRIDEQMLRIWLAPPEYVIIRKLEYFREGGSQKHLVDIRKMIPHLSGEELDTAFLEDQLDKRGLTPFWKKAQSWKPEND